MTAYYNEFDPFAAKWLQHLMFVGAIAPGDIDTRSILDVSPDDLRGYTQCHFFAGIGGWSHALRRAGWPDDRPVWTGSPPCQPFSSAGKKEGRNDERHLAPHFIELVRASRPDVLFGEQVASASVLGRVAKTAKRTFAVTFGFPEWAWWDDLSVRLEAAHYAVAAGDVPAAGVGAPHIRQRTFFGAVRLADIYDTSERLVRGGGGEMAGRSARFASLGSECSGADGRLADSLCGRQPRQGVMGRPCNSTSQEDRKIHRVVHAGGRGRLADSDCGERDGVAEQHWHEFDRQDAGWPEKRSQPGSRIDPDRSRTHHDGWTSADWLFCRDGKWRPVEPGTFPLAHGVSGRVGRLRGYGNAIVPQAAAAFIEEFQGAVTDT